MDEGESAGDWAGVGGSLYASGKSVESFCWAERLGPGGAQGEANRASSGEREKLLAD